MRKTILSLAAASVLLTSVPALARTIDEVTNKAAEYCETTELGLYVIRFKSQSGMGELINDPSQAQDRFCNAYEASQR